MNFDLIVRSYCEGPTLSIHNNIMHVANFQGSYYFTGNSDLILRQKYH